MATNETYSFVSDNVTTAYENAYKYATEVAANFTLPIQIAVPATNFTNLTISDALSSNLTNSTGLGPATDNELDVPFLLAYLISLVLVLALALWAYVRFSKRIQKRLELYDAKYKTSLLLKYRVDTNLAHTMESQKLNFTWSRDTAATSSVVPPEEFGIHSVTSANVKIKRFYISQEVSATLEDFMLADWRRTDGCQFYLDAIIWVYDLLKAVCTMHERGFYHLDLQPKMVGLNWYRYRYRWKWICKEWLTSRERKWESLMGIPPHDYRELTHPVVVLKQLWKATRCPGNLIESAKVGSDDFYKPPECFRKGLVDPAKVDAWGIGITAFEILTGGYLAIQCQLADPPIRSAAEFLRGRCYRPVMSTGIEANFNLIDNFLFQRQDQIENTVYDMNHAMFMTDCWNFISRLLCFNPDHRASVQSALNLKLMQRVLLKDNPFFINFDSLDA